MAEESIELAATHISVGISTQGLGKDLVAGIKGVGNQIGGVGKSAGADFKAGFTSASKDSAKGVEGDLKRLESAVRSQSSKVRAARDQERAAAAKLKIEEQKLAELRESGKAKASQILAAEERVAQARLKTVTATERAEVESKNLADAHDELKRASAAADAEGHRLANTIQGVGGAAKKADTESGQAATGIRGAWQKVTGVVQRLNPFSRLPHQADQAAKESTGRLRGGLSAGMAKLGPMIGAGLVGGLAAAGVSSVGDFLKESVTAASNLEQSVGGVTAVFKQAGADMLSAAKDAQTTVGLSSNAYSELSTKLGAGLKNKGIKDFAGETKKLIGLGADLAAQFGGSTSDAVDALAALMRGERDPIEKYGVGFNEAAVQAEAFAMGLAKPEKNLEKIKAAQNKAIVAQRTYSQAVKEHGKNSDEALNAEARLASANSILAKAMEGSNPKLTDQQKAMASLSLVYKQTGDAQGAFARENDTFAHKQQVAAAQWDNLQAKIGGLFLPVLTSAMGFLNDVGLPAIDGMIGSITGLGDGIGGLFGSPLPPGLAEGVAGVSSAFSGLWETAQPIFAGIQSYVMENWPEISRVAGEVWGTVQDIFGHALGGIGQSIKGFTDLAKMLWANWGSSVMGIIGDFVKFTWGTFTNLWKILSGIFDVIGGLFTGDTKRMTDGAMKIFNGFKSQVKNIFGTIVSILGHVWNGIKNVFKAPVNWVILNVLNPLIDKINGVAKAFGVSFNIPRIGLLGLHDGGGNSRGGGGTGKNRAMARGGILDGYRPVHLGDDQWVRMRSGEGVYVSEAMRDPYERWRLDRVNKAALAGRPLDEFRDLPRGTGDGLAIGGIVGYAKGGVVGGGLKAWQASVARVAAIVAKKFGLAVPYTGPQGRPQQGRFGYVSDHPRGMAADFMIPEWRRSKARGYALNAYLHHNAGPLALKYTVWDRHSYPLRLHGKPGNTINRGDPTNNHEDHVHASFLDKIASLSGLKGGGSSADELKDATKGILAKDVPGGIFGDILGGLGNIVFGWGKDKLKSVLGFDSGGWLQPGETLAVNATGKPEAVLTAPQWRAVERIADTDALTDAFEAALRRVDVGGGRKVTVYGSLVGDEAIDKVLDDKRAQKDRDKARAGVF